MKMYVLLFTCRSFSFISRQVVEKKEKVKSQSYLVSGEMRKYALYSTCYVELF